MAHASPGSSAMPRAELCSRVDTALARPPQGCEHEGELRRHRGERNPPLLLGVPAVPPLPQPRGLLWSLSPLPSRGCYLIN